MENKFNFANANAIPGYGMDQQFISLDELEKIQNNSSQPMKNANAKRKHFKFENDDIKFPNTAEETALLSTTELADLVVDKIADVFGHDVKGIADEVKIVNNTMTAACFKVVFQLSNNVGEGYVHAVQPIDQVQDSYLEQFNIINRAMKTGTIDNKTITLTTEAYDFLMDQLFDDNNCFNDMSNKKFENTYISYEHSLADNRIQQIHVHGITLEKACAFVFGPADYRVEIGAPSKEYGRLIFIHRLTKDKVKAAQYKYVGVRVNDENLRVPKFGV